MLVQVEGSDFTGKTTICKLLQDYLDETTNIETVYYHNPTGHSKISGQIYDYIKSGSCNSNEKIVMMMAALTKNFNEIKELSKTNNVVVDRGLISFYVYQFRNLSPSTFYTMLDLFNFTDLDFDKTFILTCSDEEMIRRAEERDNNDVLDSFFMTRIHEINNTYKDSILMNQLVESGEVITLDTTNLDSESCKEYVYGRMD